MYWPILTTTDLDGDQVFDSYWIDPIEAAKRFISKPKFYGDTLHKIRAAGLWTATWKESRFSNLHNTLTDTALHCYIGTQYSTNSLIWCIFQECDNFTYELAHTCHCCTATRKEFMSTAVFASMSGRDRWRDISRAAAAKDICICGVPPGEPDVDWAEAPDHLHLLYPNAKSQYQAWWGRCSQVWWHHQFELWCAWGWP